MRALIIGTGRIGKAVLRFAKASGWKWTGLNSTRLFDANVEHTFPADVSFEERLDQTIRECRPDCAFVCTPPFGDGGKKEFKILDALGHNRVPTSICTKEVLADLYAKFSKEVLPNFRGKFACNASVGGETGLLEYAKGYGIEGYGMTIDLAPNASTNFLFWRKDEVGMPQSYLEAQDFGFLEPGKGTLREKIEGEIWDGVLKGCGFFNVLDLGRGVYLTPKRFAKPTFSDRDLSAIAESKEPFRLVITFSNNESKRPLNRFCSGFATKLGGWSVVGGILAEDTAWIPPGPSAAVRIRKGSMAVPLTLSGQGAGERTANRMVLDAQHLLGL